MAKNNFQNLFDEEEERELNKMYSNNLTNVKGQVWQSLGFFRFVGDIVDAYIPKLLDAFILATGGKTTADQTTDPASGPNINDGPKGPTFDGNIDSRK
ncbi:MAG: hypothetical protein MK226_19140 [Saprospiraceae bacterium]|jgi:hypothetical protein|nr:hypothetical protein [Saprospiraceae bacterium]